MFKSFHLIQDLVLQLADDNRQMILISILLGIVNALAEVFSQWNHQDFLRILSPQIFLVSNQILFIAFQWNTQGNGQSTIYLRLPISL